MQKGAAAPLLPVTITQIAVQGTITMARPADSVWGIAVWLLLLVWSVAVTGCGQKASTDSTPLPDHVSDAAPAPRWTASYPIVRWVSVPELTRDIAIFESVFWEPDDTLSLRRRIVSDPSLKYADVLEIGTGSGLVSLCCLQAGAQQVIATDLNPAAIANAGENARSMGFQDRFQARLVPRRAPEAWSVIRADETFDLIISNPPWENRKPVTVEEFALYDPGFLLMKSLLTGAKARLRPGGRLWLAYGCVTAIRQIQQMTARESLDCRILDDRQLSELPELFLPGMLIEITVPGNSAPENRTE